MTLEEIKAAVKAGKKVHWSNRGYNVTLTIIPPRHGRSEPYEQWLIQCPSTGGCWGLTHADGVTMNGKPEEFFAEPERIASRYVIHSKSESGFWNSSIGWVGNIRGADQFTEAELAEHIMMPRTSGNDAEWIVAGYNG